MPALGFPPPKSGNYFCAFRLKKRDEAPAFRKTNRHIPIMKTPSSLSLSPLFPAAARPGMCSGREVCSGRGACGPPPAVQSAATASRQRPDVFSPPVVRQLFIFIFSLHLYLFLFALRPLVVAKSAMLQPGLGLRSKPGYPPAPPLVTLIAVGSKIFTGRQ